MKQNWIILPLISIAAVGIALVAFGLKQGSTPLPPRTIPATSNVQIQPPKAPVAIANQPIVEKPSTEVIPEKPAMASQEKIAIATLSPKKKKPELQDPTARDALSMVGADADAEEYWLAAINDLSLPANERQDLIEDLNEVGFADPKNLTVEDLPLIISRILIIEELAPDASDKVNADAFAEAYKDLINMYGKLAQR